MRIFFILITILAISCTKQNKESDISTVSFEQDSEDILSIDKNLNTAYGPSNEGTEQLENLGSREPVIGISIYSTLYNSLSFIHLLKVIEEKEINVSIISANGFSAVLAALYAKEKSASYVEWKIFEMRKGLVGFTPFSTQWRAFLKKFLIKEFKNVQLQQMKALLLVPIINKGSVELKSTGLVSDVLIRSLNLLDETNFIRKASVYTEQLRDFSTDVSIEYYSLSTRPKLSSLEGLNYGLYTKYVGELLNDSELDRVSSITQLGLDDFLPLSDIIKNFEDGNNQLIEKLVDKINQWKQENTPSSN